SFLWQIIGRESSRSNVICYPGIGANVKRSLQTHLNRFDRMGFAFFRAAWITQTTSWEFSATASCGFNQDFFN
ncbi:MAG TPA: hypothetical protein VNT76_00810, partial [Candidatus Binatus sp.]|nr:hypothetical protein [Candidatus Binatus sp.]